MTRDVLIVDDSATIRQMIRRTIQLIDLDIGEMFEAGNGIEALAQLADHEVACVIVDINMPSMNGIQLLRRMKDNPHLKDIPVVVVSTEGSAQRIQQIEEWGASGFVRKPFQPEQLRDVLKPMFGVKVDGGGNPTETDEGAF
ncbi:MAG: Chemotaxis protein CheY [Phycisphaerae bacterium]|nr:Chemotaxis protein CheY [Phycisphaerae bacterium]